MINFYWTNLSLGSQKIFCKKNCVHIFSGNIFSTDIYLFKFNNRSNIMMCEVCSKTRRRSFVFWCVSIVDIEQVNAYLANIYLFKVNQRNTRKRCEIFHWRRSAVFIVDFEHVSHLFLVFLWLTFSKEMLAG